MVTDMVSYRNILLVAEKKGIPREIRKVLEELKPEIQADKASRKRLPRPPAPEGGITIRSASTKYEIANTTLQGWVNKQYIKIISIGNQISYIDEARVAQLAKIFKSNPGRGSWAVKQFILQEQQNS